MSTKKKQEKRPSSDNFVDLHIFVVPYELWMEKYRTAYNSSTLESISAGFVRVPPLMTLEDLRTLMKDQLSGGDILPDEFVFLRCVGRCLAIVNKVQELSLKVKHFLPPVVSSPEIFVLFGNHDNLFHNFASSVNTASDIQDYNTTVRGYLMYTREIDENSKSSSPERLKTDTLDRDAIQRRVHFGQNNDSTKKDNEDHSLKENVHENAIKTNEETYLTEIPPATKSNLSEEIKHDAQDFSNSGQGDQTLSYNGADNEKPYREGRRLSTGLAKEQDVHDSRVYPDDVNDVTSHALSTDNTDYNHDTKQMSSSFEDKHSKSPRNKPQRKNPLLHSKTAPSLLQTPSDDTVDGKSAENERNKERNEATKGVESSQNTESLNNKEGEYYISREYPDDHLEPETKNKSEIKDKPNDDFEHRRVEADNHSNKNKNNNNNDDNKNNFQTENISASGNGTDYKETNLEDSAQENIKHSADTSVASSGFESLNQSNNNRNDDIADHTENSFGVTIADKENLVLQLQAELNAVRSERSNSEKTREQLLKKAKNLQSQNNQKRTQAKTVWKKRYFEEKKKTVSLEERCNQLRYEVEVIHKKILSSGDAKDHGSASSYLHKDGDPKKLNAKIMLTRKENEVEELRRRVEEAKIKLGSEMKLRDNAQKELKQIRDEVIDKKINATLVKKSLSLLETHNPNDV